MLDKLETNTLGIRARIRFVSYLHEERFAHCLDLMKRNMTPGIEALLYILSGCNELWNVGVEKMYNFEAGGIITDTDYSDTLTINGKTLLKLAHHLAMDVKYNDLVHTLRCYFPGLEHVHLELAIEAIKLAYLPEIKVKSEIVL